MKKYTHNELKKILNNIKNGVVYCGISPTGYGIGRIYKISSGYIGWQHYGESVNKMNIRDLRFIIEVIFNCCDCITPAEWSDYHVGYIPIDKQYKGIDYSMSHPNVFGM